jgi:hypothetical protein
VCQIGPGFLIWAICQYLSFYNSRSYTLRTASFLLRFEVRMCKVGANAESQSVEWKLVSCLGSGSGTEVVLDRLERRTSSQFVCEVVERGWSICASNRFCTRISKARSIIVDPMPTPLTAATCFKAGCSGFASNISMRPRLEVHQVRICNFSDL